MKKNAAVVILIVFVVSLYGAPFFSRAGNLECPPGAYDEQEPCGESVNGGCGDDPVVFTDIDCGRTICGTAWANDWVRDTDWYRLVLTGPAEVAWTVETGFDALAGLVETDPPGSGDCRDMTGILDPWASVASGETVTLEMTLAEGVHWLWVATEDFTGHPCPAGPWDYVFSVDCGGCTDDDGDGYAIEGDECGSIDCNDADASVNPGADESGEAGNCGDGIDNDCDGLTDTDPACGECFIGATGNR